jgi:hypothetical protein
MMPVAGLVLCLWASMANAQWYGFSTGGYFPRRAAFGWGGYAPAVAWGGYAPAVAWGGYSPAVAWGGFSPAAVTWGGFSPAAVATVAAPNTVVLGSGGCIGQMNYGLTTMGFAQPAAYSYVPVNAGVVMTTQGSCSGGTASGANLQQVNAALTSINNTLTTMNTTLTAMDKRLSAIETSLTVLTKKPIEKKPPDLEKLPQPAPAPSPEGTKKPMTFKRQETDAPLTPQMDFRNNAHLAQATERNRVATAQLQALLQNIKTRTPEDHAAQAKPKLARAD